MADSVLLQANKVFIDTTQPIYEERLEEKCKDNLFVALSTRITHFDKIAFHLELTQADIEQIRRDKDREQARILAVLWKWRAKRGNYATYSALLTAFMEMDDREMAEFIEEYVKCSGPSSSTKVPFTPEKTEEKFLNWEKLTDNERERIKNELQEENNLVREKFACLFIDILNSFEQKQVEYMKLKIFLQLSLRIYSHKVIFPDLEAAESLMNVFSFLSKHCSWYNFEVLESVVKKFGSIDDEKLLSVYIEGILKPYLERSIFEIPPDSLGANRDPAALQQVYLKLPDDLVPSGCDIKLIQTKLAKRMGIPTSILQLQSYCMGCIELEFIIERVYLTDLPNEIPLFIDTIWDDNKQVYFINADILTILFFDHNVKGELSVVHKLLNVKKTKIDDHNEENGKHNSQITATSCIRDIEMGQLKQSVEEFEISSPISQNEFYKQLEVTSQEDSYVTLICPPLIAGHSCIKEDNDKPSQNNIFGTIKKAETSTEGEYSYGLGMTKSEKEPLSDKKQKMPESIPLPPKIQVFSNEKKEKMPESILLPLPPKIQVFSNEKKEKMPESILPPLPPKIQEFSEERRKWYMDCTSQQAEKLLRKKRAGTFLCRPSEKTKMCSNGALHTHTIVVMSDRVRQWKVFYHDNKYGLNIPCLHNSLEDLIQYHVIYPLVPDGTSDVKLVFPINIV